MNVCSRKSFAMRYLNVVDVPSRMEFFSTMVGSDGGTGKTKNFERVKTLDDLYSLDDIDTNDFDVSISVDCVIVAFIKMNHYHYVEWKKTLRSHPMWTAKLMKRLILTIW